MTTASPRNRLVRFSAVVGAATLLVVAIHPPGGWGVPICWTRELIELPCPGCGLLRSMSSTVAGEFAAAWNYHPFGPLMLVMAIAMCVRPLLPESFQQRCTAAPIDRRRGLR